MGMRVQIDLDGMTFGDLYDFVDAARGSGIEPTAPVTQIPLDPMDEDRGVGSLEATLDSSVHYGEPVVLEPGEAKELAAFMQDVLDSDGDVRGSLDTFRKWRDRLLDL